MNTRFYSKNVANCPNSMSLTSPYIPSFYSKNVANCQKINYKVRIRRLAKTLNFLHSLQGWGK